MFAGSAEVGARRGAHPLLLAPVVALALAIPFFLVDVPPVLDYPNHLARYFVLANPDDPVLSQIYAAQWRILPNIGMDLIAANLLKFTSVHVGGQILLALSLFAPVIGVVAYHRVTFGRFGYWPLASGVVAFNGVFLLGFMNFLLSLGLAFAGAAVWTMLRRRSHGWIAVMLGAIAAVVIFFCHIFGVVLFALLIGGEEAVRLLQRQRAGSLSVAAVMRAAGMIAFAMGPAVVLYALSPLSSEAPAIGEWRGLAKLWALFTPFMTPNAELTLLSGVIVVALGILIRRDIAVAPTMVPALAALVAMFAVAPSSLKGGTFVDVRLALMAWLVLFAGVQPRLAPRSAALVGVTFTVLIGLRIGYVASTWIDHRQDLANLRAAIAEVPPGARVLTARGRPGQMTDVRPPQRALPGIYRLDGNLGALLVIERRAFWPLLFADPRQQPLKVKPPFDRIAHPLSEAVEWTVLSDDAVSARTLSGARYLQDWRSHFDYVLLIDPQPAAAPVRGLLPVYRGPYAVLYRVARQSTDGAAAPAASPPL